MSYLKINEIYAGRSEELMKNIEPNSISLSFWSPPYFVGKEYEKDETFDTWQNMLKDVMSLHYSCLKPGGFCVVNIADIMVFPDERIPRFQALNVSKQRIKITREQILEAMKKHPDYNRNKLAKLLGCSEQTIDRRLNGNNIRGGKYQVQTKVKLVGHYLEEYAEDAGLYLYDRRIWKKDPAWINSKWISSTLKSVSEFEDLYVFWKPGEYSVNKDRLSSKEWKEWGHRQIWEVSSVRKNDNHEAMFPIELAERVVRLFSDKDDIVLDPFIGSGTTAIAAFKNSRSYIGLEKEKKYVDLAKQKIKLELQQTRLSI